MTQRRMWRWCRGCPGLVGAVAGGRAHLSSPQRKDKPGELGIEAGECVDVAARANRE
jgi:hypothetical protein